MKDPETVVHVSESPHSVEISRNASGGYAFAVKSYGMTPEAAMEQSKRIVAQLDTDYPPARK